MTQQTGSDKTAIRPFHVNVSEAELTELRTRIKATKWPEREPDATQGVQLATIQALARYWATEYDWPISSARLYWENKGSFFGVKGVTVPAAVSVFPEEIYQPPRSWAERAYPRLVHYNKLDRGGHFAAWEQPKLLCEEVRAGLRSLRK